MWGRPIVFSTPFDKKVGGTYLSRPYDNNLHHAKRSTGSLLIPYINKKNIGFIEKKFISK